VFILRLFEQGIGTDSSDGVSYLKRQLKAKIHPDMEPFKRYLIDNMQNFVFLSNIGLIDDNFINNMEQFERDFWGKLLGSRTDKKVTAILNDVYETEIEHFTFKPYSIDKQRRREADRYKLFSALADIALHIDDYGDGFRYAFIILTSALRFKKRVLLIEEIESHQHAGSLKKLIPILIKIAKTNDLQLFITTHSFDVWRYFMYSFEDEQTRKEDFRSFHVVRDANTGKVDVSQEYDVQKIKEDIFEIEY
jgi:AAA15 family ATPase/GTPase